MTTLKRQTALPPDNNNNDYGFYRIDSVLALIPVSRRTWWRGVKTGRYPKPVKISSQVDGWEKRAIHRLCDELVAMQVKP